MQIYYENVKNKKHTVRKTAFGRYTEEFRAPEYIAEIGGRGGIAHPIPLKMEEKIYLAPLYFLRKIYYNGCIGRIQEVILCGVGKNWRRRAAGVPAVLCRRAVPTACSGPDPVRQN